MARNNEVYLIRCDFMKSEPESCRPQDWGKFEIISRDGAARIGKFHTLHGAITTPMLLPVVNPNLRTIEPREMWEKYGVEALITNSYVIWKHEKLSVPAKQYGIHKLIDFPGAIVTDSGTFQSYVYGDVEVSPKEIVEFQREIGVDVGTMLDVFGRPDMSREEAENSVNETYSRVSLSLSEAGDSILLNGPIQGGVYEDLRAKSAELMSRVDESGATFAIHPIGGIVPLMEKQRYQELFSIILAVKSQIPPNKPIHMFGCGHPMLFPLSVALGVDFFDSAAYVLFARDDRILTPEGTVKVQGLKEWPISSEALFGRTPSEVLSLPKEERSEILARHNLEVTQSELSKCREAIRNGSIWRLAEVRSHASPRLREAFEWVIDKLEKLEETEIGSSLLDIMASTNPIRKGGEPLSDDIEYRPHILHLMALISLRWRPPGSWWDGSSGPVEKVLILDNSPPPWREGSMGTIVNHLLDCPRTVVLISTPLGPVPYSFEDVSPFCHVDGSDNIWNNQTDLNDPSEEILYLGLENSDVVISKSSEPLQSSSSEIDKVRAWLDRCSIVDKLSVFCATHPFKLCEITNSMNSRRSNTDRMVNVSFGGVHALSPRLKDGGVSLTAEGARMLYSLNDGPPDLFGETNPDEEKDFPGIPRVMIRDDAIPFVGKGRNVMHGYVLGADSHVTPGQPCVVVSEKGELVAHGVPTSTSSEMACFTKGIAVRIRQGVLKE